MVKNTLAAALCAAFSLHAQAAACPGGAAWCDDFESGAGRWQTAAAAVRIEPASANHVLRASDGETLLVTAAPTTAAHFVEARLRPTAGGKAYLLAQYVDERNWIGAGFTPNGNRVLVELEAMRDGKLVRLKQVRREAGDGFRTLRLEVGGDALAVYLDGERLTSAPARFQPGG